MTDPAAHRETIAVVVVTHNRADLLARTLNGLAASTRPIDAVFVIDNDSTDATPDLLAARTDLPLRVTRQANLGGAGGFHAGVQQAYAAGFDRIWLMDDDVVPAPNCLAELLRYDDDCLMVVREDLTGALVEKSAVRFDLRRPWYPRPKRASIDSTWATRAAMPERVGVEVVAFEGLLIKREVIDAIGLPDPSYFIFYDDADFAIRARAAGFSITCVRDAVMVRQLDFNQQHALDTWKGYYMYRNLFTVHFRYGENLGVRLKPWLITLMVIALSPLRGGRGEAANVRRALIDAWRARHETAPTAVPL